MSLESCGKAENQARTAEIKRKTNETDIFVKLNIDGTGKSCISTGVEFFDHMLTQISRHGFFDLEIKAIGDTGIDSHHTVEDVGITLGKAFSEALGNKEGIKRYGHSILPMEEALVMCAADFSSRPFLAYSAEFTVDKLGSFETEMIEEFFRAFCINSGLNLHIKVLDGKNNHHIAECIFKSFAKTIDSATGYDSRVNGVLSSKGMLE